MSKASPVGILVATCLVAAAILHDCDFQKRESAGRELAIGGGLVPVAPTKSALRDLTAGRQADCIRTPDHTRVRVLDYGPLACEVELESGPYAGRAGWVAQEWIK